jgi:hypothetical protein
MVTFGWDLCHRCNYRCPYCGVWKDHPEQDRIFSPQEWQTIWDRMHDLYGKCHIFISGGEPSVYPGFPDLVRLLCRNHLPEICTNLSWDVGELVPALSPQQLRIAPTFHPTFADFEAFFAKAVRIREYLPDSQVYYVAYPSQIREMPERSARCRDAGIKLIPLPLRGDGFVLNSEEEKKDHRGTQPVQGEREDGLPAAADIAVRQAVPRGTRVRGDPGRRDRGPVQPVQGRLGRFYPVAGLQVAGQSPAVRTAVLPDRVPVDRGAFRVMPGGAAA